MAIPIALILQAASAASSAAGAIGAFRGAGKGGPDFGELRQRLLQNIGGEEQRAFSQAASGAQARFASRGLAQSGSIQSVIQDAQARIAGQFQGRRNQALGRIREQEIRSQQLKQQQRQAALSGLAGAGASLFGLSQQFGQNQQQQQAGQQSLQSTQQQLAPFLQFNQNQFDDGEFDFGNQGNQFEQEQFFGSFA